MMALGPHRPAGRARCSPPPGSRRRSRRARCQARPSAGAAARSRCCGGRRPTLLNPHFATGTKDQDGSRIFYEPLAAYDPDGNLFPVLAAEIPSVQNGGVAKDGKSVTWKLKKGVTWHDGKPFTADDVRLQLGVRAPIPRPRRGRIGSYKDIEKIDVLDRHTVRVVLQEADARSGPTPSAACDGMIIPKHLFEAYKGEKSREAPTNLKPVGTGPYKFVDFKPGDIVRGEHQPELPRAQPALLRHRSR